ncbi:MAG: HAMP domain-containing histidine kinase [Epsilonproteobacteria bacterium]|nr:sensor histidine kinase [Campylobacterota bacterium]NPA57013.1 HAMP domain-containing histidine kinase [Campylobacterota bacterium]
MLSSQSLKSKLLWQLIFASAVLVGVFSTILYNFIKTSIYEEAKDQLLKQAHYIVSNSPEKLDTSYLKTLDISVKIIPKPRYIDDITVIKSREGERTYLLLYYPYNFEEQSFLFLKKDVSSIEEFLDQLLQYIVVTHIITFFFIIALAYFISSNISYHIERLTVKLSKLNEEVLQPIKTRDLPVEFQPLGKSINILIKKVKTYIKYQKKLFVGVAHELKTPLAVIKLKNEVALLKRRSPEEYIETIKLTLKTVDEINKMIQNLLRIGRQEGDQFENPVTLDIIDYLREKSNNYRLLAESEGKRLVTDLQPKSYVISIQPTLLNHIIQNFVQNAIKFTPPGGTITLKSTPITNGLKIEVIDEGPGVNEKEDLFAPFKRFGSQSGVGLGLFLAKSAADAMGASVSVKNRKDRKGTVATLIIPAKLVCPLC